jgi:hypothetical protein
MQRVKTLRCQRIRLKVVDLFLRLIATSRFLVCLFRSYGLSFSQFVVAAHLLNQEIRAIH